MPTSSSSNSLALNNNPSYIPWNFDNNVPLSSFQKVFKVSRFFCFYLHRSYQILTHEYPSKANIQKNIKNLMKMDINTMAWLYAGVLFLVLVATYLGPKICFCCKNGCEVIASALNKMMRKWAKSLRFGIFLCCCANYLSHRYSEGKNQKELRKKKKGGGEKCYWLKKYSGEGGFTQSSDDHEPCMHDEQERFFD